VIPADLSPPAPLTPGALRVTALGGIPLTYIQTSYRSEDYAKAFEEVVMF
jgi:hypothetical protein